MTKIKKYIRINKKKTQNAVLKKINKSVCAI